MKATIGDLFRALKYAEQKTRDNMHDSVLKKVHQNGDGKIQNYGELLAARCTLDKLLEDCEHEIELSPNKGILLSPVMPNLK